MDSVELLGGTWTALRTLWALSWLLVPGLLAAWLVLPAGIGLSARLVWGFGSSVLLYSLGALLLSATAGMVGGMGGGISRQGWMVLLTLAIAGTAGLWRATAALRQRRYSEPLTSPADPTQWATRFVAQASGSSTQALTTLARSLRPQLPALLAATLLTLLAFGLARSGLADSAPPRTELWVEAHGSGVRVSVLNREGRPSAYRVEISTPQATEPLASHRIGPLASGTQQQLDVEPAPGADPLLITLYRDDIPLPYRHVSISRSALIHPQPERSRP